jgi:hypothetical protein
MTPNEPRSMMQMNLQFCRSEPMLLPEDKQRELAIALADLLLNAVIVEPTQCDEGDRR